jgi:hypothetical protein
METTTMTFTAEQWMRHEKVVQALRAYKRRKREWQERMEKELTAREERVRQRRAEVDALFDD